MRSWRRQGRRDRPVRAGRLAVGTGPGHRALLERVGCEHGLNCNDSTFRSTDALVAAKGTKWIAKYPIFGTLQAWNLYSCHGWPRAEHPTPPPSAPKSASILVIGTIHDPATPYAGAVVLARALGRGVLLTWNGEGHTAYLQTACITARVDAYVLTAKAPANLVCPAR